MGVLQAQMSMKYCMARTVIDGMLSPAQFTEDKLSDPLAIDLASRVHFILDEEINKLYPREFPSIVEIVMKDGPKYRVRINVPKGSVENPMTWREVQDKFSSLTRDSIDEKNADAIIELVANLENVRDVAEITRLMKK
jgi:2-methylcitrate dehydratase